MNCTCTSVQTKAINLIKSAEGTRPLVYWCHSLHGYHKDHSTWLNIITYPDHLTVFLSQSVWSHHLALFDHNVGMWWMPNILFSFMAATLLAVSVVQQLLATWKPLFIIRPRYACKTEQTMPDLWLVANDLLYICCHIYESESRISIAGKNMCHLYK